MISERVVFFAGELFDLAVESVAERTAIHDPIGEKVFRVFVIAETSITKFHRAKGEIVRHTLNVFNACLRFVFDLFDDLGVGCGAVIFLTISALVAEPEARIFRSKRIFICAISMLRNYVRSSDRKFCPAKLIQGEARALSGLHDG